MNSFTRWTVLSVLLMALTLTAVPAGTADAAPSDQACWGQATKVFAATGVMGSHASSQDNPRLGLRNLARLLFDQGVIEDDTLQALGAFVAGELGLDVSACM